MLDEVKLHERVMKLEMVFMHLEQSVGALDEVVRSQQKAIDAIEVRLSRLTRPTPVESEADSAGTESQDDGV